MDEFIFPMDNVSLFETTLNNNNNYIEDNDNSMDMDIEMESSISIFKEFEEIQEVKEEAPNNTSLLLHDLISECGILVEEPSVVPSSPQSSISEHQNLIDELEQFFGSPTMIENEEKQGIEILSKGEISTQSKNPDEIINAALNSGMIWNRDDIEVKEELDLKNAVTTSCITENGENVIIIIAPPMSPAESLISSSDPDWSPDSPLSPSSYRGVSTNSRTIRKKYQRKNPPTPPQGPYPVEKKERKKAQNRTAAFRYREKKKSEQDMIEDELEALSTKNVELKSKLSEMEKEAKLLKKLMIEVGLGKYANAIKV